MAEISPIIKFNPEKIADVGLNLGNQHKRFIQSLSNIQKKAGVLTNNWSSESGLVYMDKIRELNDQSEEMAKILLALSLDLINVSGIYKTSESQAKQKAEALPTEGVFLV